MRKLIAKEFRLAAHPTAPLFLLLSSMLLIPNYPYYVVFFYTGLSIFFTCLAGRENNDVFYSMTLPIAKQDIVKGRFGFVILLEIAQIIIAIPFALLRQSLPIEGNQVGMDANMALFGLSLVMLGGFNWIFFSIYYKNVQRVGVAFMAASGFFLIYMLIAETLVHVVPFFRDVLDTPDPQHLGAKLVVLGIGVVLFGLLTLFAYKKSIRNFERQDL